jgi:hypothetical protein
MAMAGDIEQANRSGGEAQAIALHAAAGAITAALGGGNALQGAEGAAAAQAVGSGAGATTATAARSTTTCITIRTIRMS